MTPVKTGMILYVYPEVTTSNDSNSMSKEEMNYKVPDQTMIGHVHLKVSDLQKSLQFYTELLGFQITTLYGDQAAFLSAGGYHHHIGLNTWQSRNAAPAAKRGVGLFHAAILYPTRKDLAEIFLRLRDHDYPLTGAADHELYWDRPKTDWPLNPDGSLHMYTRSLDLEGLLQEAKKHL